MTMATSQPEAPARKLRWFQYSLGSLMLLTLVVSLVMSWVAVRMKSARQQKEAVEEVKKRGGRVFYDHQPFPAAIAEPPGPAWLRNLLGQDFFATVVAVGLFPPGPSDAGFEHLKSLTQLRELSLIGPCFTDASLEHLKGLTNLRSLDLEETSVTDAGLEHLKALTRLESLSISLARVTGAGFEHLKGLRQLRELALGFDATDASLERIKGLTQVQKLSLFSMCVTDAGLRHLRGMAQLRKLSLFQTNVTDGDVKRLREALPRCVIDRVNFPIGYFR